MSRESNYLSIESPWNFGASYSLNDYLTLSTQYLHGSQLSVAANIKVNPGRPPILGGKELAPVPMRLRGGDAPPIKKSDKILITKVLEADRFRVHYLKFEGEKVTIAVTNTKFRSTAQALGRVGSTLQRFTSDDITIANISFISQGLQTATYRVNLEKILREQYYPTKETSGGSSIVAIDVDSVKLKVDEQRFTWGIGPYFAHRLFNPDLPLSMEVGLEVKGSYHCEAENFQCIS